MKLKPKSTVQHTRALWYRRFTDLQTAVGSSTVYELRWESPSGSYVRYWYYLFDKEHCEFMPIKVEDLPASFAKIQLRTNVWYTFGNYYFYFNYDTTTGTVNPIKTETRPENIFVGELNSYSNIGKYQLNRYYACGSFDFMIKGSITGTTTQRLKGNIIPLTSMNIVHYNDSIQLEPDDLVVVEGRLYSVENPEVEHKHQPKPFNVYYATLNSIL